MQIFHDSELMENQKHAVVMAPDTAFDVLQSQNGDALFFSIGSDGVFYLTREVTQTATGWTKVDLSSALSSQHGGATVEAKTFAISQNPDTLQVDLALVVTVSGGDMLYLSLANANTDASWGNGVTWAAAPFDAPQAPAPLTIADVYIMSLPATAGPAAGETIFADVVRTPGDALQLLDRYYVTPAVSPQWNQHLLPADVAAGSVSSRVGIRQGDAVAGIYTFGTISGEQQLLFTPQVNEFQAGAPPSPVRLSAPAGATAVATALGAGGTTLFVAATGGLFAFDPANQKDGATAVQIATGSVAASATMLAASTTGNRTAVWGLNAQQSLFYVWCAAGNESTPGAWSAPVPLLANVAGFAFFLNAGAGNNVMFAASTAGGGQTLLRLAQDPVTTAWLERSILLPGTDSSDMAVFDSFTTHIRIADDNGISAPLTAVTITPARTASVYVNDIYYAISPSAPLQTTCDETGVLTIVEETQSLAATCFTIALPGTPGVSATINPMTRATAILGGIENGDDLANVQVTNVDGSQSPLLPPTTTTDQRNAVASSIAQLVKVGASLPQDGSRTAAAAPAASASSGPGSWSVSFAAGGATYSAQPSAAPSPLDVLFGDVVRAAEAFIDDVEQVWVVVEGPVYRVLVSIGGAVYRAVIDNLPGAVALITSLFEKLEVVFEDIVKWLGFIFQWSDIINTHKVLRNVMTLGIGNALDQLPALSQQIRSAFDSLEAQIDSWAQIPDTTATLGSYTQPASATPGFDSPQANWGMHQMKSNIGAATVGPPIAPAVATVDSVVADLATLVANEGAIISTTVQQLQTDVIDQITTLTPAQVAEKIAAIVTDDLLSTAENVILAALAVLQAAAAGAAADFEVTIDIPVLSPIYHQITGDDLSLLDLVCLIAAIPATILYKLAAGAAPFTSAEAATLGGAPNYVALTAALTGNTSTANA
jgi:hypothetical protein